VRLSCCRRLLRESLLLHHHGLRLLDLLSRLRWKGNLRLLGKLGLGSWLLSWLGLLWLLGLLHRLRVLRRLGALSWWCCRRLLSRADTRCRHHWRCSRGLGRSSLGRLRSGWRGGGGGLILCCAGLGAGRQALERR